MAEGSITTVSGKKIKPLESLDTEPVPFYSWDEIRDYHRKLAGTHEMEQEIKALKQEVVALRRAIERQTQQAASDLQVYAVWKKEFDRLNRDQDKQIAESDAEVEDLLELARSIAE